MLRSTLSLIASISAMGSAMGAVACSKSSAEKPAAAAATPVKTEVKAGDPAAEQGAPGSPVTAARTHVEGQGFVVDVTAPAAAKVGEKVVAKVVLTPTGEYHVNKDFPTSLKVAAPAGVEVGKAELGKGDAVRFEEKGAEFAVEFTAKEGGTKSLEATFKFAVCTETTCDPKREKLAWNVDVR